MLTKDGKIPKFKDFIINKDKVGMNSEWMKRVYRLAVFWVKRYNIPCKKVSTDYGWYTNKQKKDGKIILRLIFHIDDND